MHSSSLCIVCNQPNGCELWQICTYMHTLNMFLGKGHTYDDPHSTRSLHCLKAVRTHTTKHTHNVHTLRYTLRTYTDVHIHQLLHTKCICNCRQRCTYIQTCTFTQGGCIWGPLHANTWWIRAKTMECTMYWCTHILTLALVPQWYESNAYKHYTYLFTPSHTHQDMRAVKNVL